MNLFCIMCTRGLVTSSTLKPSWWIKSVYDNKLFQRRIHGDGKWTSANCYVSISIQHLNFNAVAVLSIFGDSQRRIKAKLENVYLTFYAFWPEDTPLNLSFCKEKIISPYGLDVRYTKVVVYNVVMADYMMFTRWKCL